MRNENIIKPISPSITWTQYMDYFLEVGKYMKSTYARRMRANKPITQDELDKFVNKIHKDLDLLLT